MRSECSTVRVIGVLVIGAALGWAAGTGAGSGSVDLVVWGDSMASDLTAERLGAGLKAAGVPRPDRVVVNCAVGGQSSWQAGVRQGALPWTVEVVGGTVPASGRVELCDHRTPLRDALSEEAGGAIPPGLHERAGWMSRLDDRKATWVEVAGVTGQVVAEGSGDSRKIYFVRRGEGEPVAVKNPASVQVLGIGPGLQYRLEDLNAAGTAILWPFGPHLSEFIRAAEVYGSEGGLSDASLSAKAEVEIVRAMIANLSAPEKRVILLFDMRTSPPPSNSRNDQNNRIHQKAISEACAKQFPEAYFDFVEAFAKGFGGVPPAKEWLRKNYPDEFGDPDLGWHGPREAIPLPNGGSQPVSFTEPAAAARIEVRSGGGSGARSADGIETATPGATMFRKTGLKVDAVAEDGIVTALTIREGGRGYEVGDQVVIPAGRIGNAETVEGVVTATRAEVMGTVRKPDGSVDETASFSEWDQANGYIPRVFRRDMVHFTPRGAEYLALVLAELIKSKGW